MEAVVQAAPVLEACVWQGFSAFLQIPDLRNSTDFFRSGGNSILAALLAARLSQTTGQRVQIEDVYRYPTPLAMAAFLRESEAVVDDGEICVTPLRLQGSSTMVICLPSLLDIGRLAWLEAEAEKRSAQLFVVHPPRLRGRSRPVVDSIAQLAQTAAHRLAAKANGPVRLIGFCLGAYVAWPLADALRRLGSEVLDVVALDPPHPRLREVRPIVELLGLPSMIPPESVPLLCREVERLQAERPLRQWPGAVLRDRLLDALRDHAGELAGAIALRFPGMEGIQPKDVVQPYVEWVAFTALTIEADCRSQTPTTILFVQSQGAPAAADVDRLWSDLLADSRAVGLEVHHYELLRHELMVDPDAGKVI